MTAADRPLPVSTAMLAPRDRDVTRYHETMAKLERGLTPQEIADAAAALARPPNEKQGNLF